MSGSSIQPGPELLLGARGTAMSKMGSPRGGRLRKYQSLPARGTAVQ